MASCRDVDRLLTAYLDAEASAVERRDVDAHLAECATCARRARAEDAARRVLMLRGPGLAVHAPADLRLRCAALAPRPLGGRRPWDRAWRSMSGWQRTGLAWASVATLAVAAVLAYGAVSHSPTLLAAELRMDHMKCFAFFEPRERDADPAAVAAQLLSDYGWKLRIPGSLASERLTLLGARRCFSTDGGLAHVLYRHAGRPVSLFVMPKTSRPEARVELAGRVATIWSAGATTYVLLADESERDLQPVAAYFRSATPVVADSGT
jgi:anti-sigma factor RsiW